MAEEINGHWQARDGSYHTTEGYARKHEQDLDRGAGSDGGGFAGSAGGWLITLLLIGPVIAGKIFGWIFGALTLLGMVGKILQTAIMVIVGFFFGLIFSNALQMWIPAAVILVIPLMFGCAILAGFWFFLYHSDAVKLMDISGFSGFIKKSCSFIWFGWIGGAVIGWIAGSDELVYVVGSLAMIAGVVYYALKTKPYAQEAEQNMEQPQKAGKKKIMLIAAAAVGALSILFCVIGIIEFLANK
jgi:hypothetical protein